MSQTIFQVNDPLAVKRWSASLQKATPKQSWFMKSGFVGTNPERNVIVVKNDLQGAYGDKVTYAIRQQLRGYTTPGDQNLSQNIKSLTYLDDEISINQQRTGVNTGGKMSNKRVPYNTRKDARETQADYWGVHLDEEILAKLSGALGVGQWETINPNASGFDVMGAVDCDGNTLRTPSTNRLVVAGTGTKLALTNADTFNLDVVDTALLLITRIAKNTTTRRKMVPLRVNGRNLWVCLLDSVQARDLKKNIGQRWGQIELAKIQGGFKDSAFVQQSLGVYESFAGAVAFFSHEGMVKFNDYGAGANLPAARALLMGQAGGCYAPGEKMGEDGVYTSWHEQDRNNGNEVEISTGMIYGFQKTAYRTTHGAGTREDYGVCAIDTYADWT